MSSGLWSANEEHDILAQEFVTQEIQSCKGSPGSDRVLPGAPAVSRCDSEMPSGRDRGDRRWTQKSF